MSQPAIPNQNPESGPSKTVAETLLSPSILEAIPDAVAAVNQQGVIIRVNSQTETLFGYTREELIGQKIEMLVPERQRPQHHSHREHFHQQPKIRRMGSGLDLSGRRRDGSEFPVEISLSPVATGDGTIVLSVIRDISDRKRIEDELRRVNEELDRRKSRELRDSQNRLALIVDSSQDAIIGKNLDGTITHWNKGAEHMYGYAAAEMIGRPISVLAPQERADEIPTILEKFATESESNTLRRCESPRTGGTCTSRFRFLPSTMGRGRWWGPRPLPAISLRRKRSRINCGNRKRWRRWDGWRVAWHTTST